MNKVLGSNDGVIVDNNVLQDFVELGRLEILFESYKEIIIPDKVFKEEISDFVLLELQKQTFKVVSLRTEEGYATLRVLVSDKKYKRLSECDRLVVSTAKEVGSYCGSNDNPIRKACADFGISCIGTLGILEQSFLQDRISKDEFFSLARKLLSEDTSCYIKPSVVNEVLRNYD